MAPQRPTYTAICTRSGAWWAVQVRELPGVFTQARRLDHVEDRVREAIALFTQGGRDSFDVAVDVELRPEWKDALDRAKKLRQEAEESQRAANEAARRAALILVGDGLTVRDAGRLLGVHNTRVSQLVADHRD